MSLRGSLTAAYPYYASVLSTMAAFFVFSLVFLVSQVIGSALKGQR